MSETQVQNAIDAQALRYAVKAIKNLYLEAKKAGNTALAAEPIDWDRYTRYSSECFALAGALGALGVIDLPEVK